MNPESITEYLSRDHDRLDAILVNVRGLVGRGELGGAEAAYKEFQTGLSRHIRLEEELLFPAFERLTGMTQGPTAVMRHEHRAIEHAMGLIQSALAEKHAADFSEGIALLEDVLPAHNLKEERILYPGTDDLLAPAERTALVDQLRRG